MPVWTARCRNQDPGYVSMGANQRGTSWATIPKTLNRARTVHTPCAHRATTPPDCAGKECAWIRGVGKWFCQREIVLHALWSRARLLAMGWSPLPNLLPSLLPKLPNLVPRAKPSTKGAAKPAAQLAAMSAAKPAAGEPFQWPLLSMCSFSKSTTPARKSGAQSLSPSRAEQASQQAFSRSFVDHIPVCLHVLLLVVRPLCSAGALGNHHFGYVAPGVWGYHRAQAGADWGWGDPPFLW